MINIYKHFFGLGKREYLNNSLVVITGDHSWPLGEHGYYYNESGHYNEFYKTAALFIWKNNIKNYLSKNLHLKLILHLPY